MLYMAFGQVFENADVSDIAPYNNAMTLCKCDGKTIIFLKSTLRPIVPPQPIQINKLNSNYSNTEKFFNCMPKIKAEVSPDWVLFNYNDD